MVNFQIKIKMKTHFKHLYNSTIIGKLFGSAMEIFS
jgi:hypothetical protein